MTSKETSLIVTAAVGLSSLIGGAIYWWLTKKPEAKVEVKKTVRVKNFPDEILPEQMENEMDELAASMPGGVRERYYDLCDKIQVDMRWDSIPWLRQEEFDFDEYKKFGEFMMMGLSFVVHTVNRMRKGEYLPEFEVCVRESADIAISAAIRVGECHSALKSRNIQLSVRELIELVSSLKGQGLPKEVAV